MRRVVRVGCASVAGCFLLIVMATAFVEITGVPIAVMFDSFGAGVYRWPMDGRPFAQTEVLQELRGVSSWGETRTEYQMTFKLWGPFMIAHRDWERYQGTMIDFPPQPDQAFGLFLSGVGTASAIILTTYLLLRWDGARRDARMRAHER